MTDINSIDKVDNESLLKLGRNLSTIATLRHRRINGMTPDNWMLLWETRVGYEPVFRLCFALSRAMDSAHITLMEVLAEDPILMVECLNNGNMLPYHLEYSQPCQSVVPSHNQPNHNSQL